MADPPARLAAALADRYRVYRELGQWGSRPGAGTGTWISVNADLDRFVDVLTAV